jgi:hypothetical protein
MVFCTELQQDVPGMGSIRTASYNSEAMTKATSTVQGGMEMEPWTPIAPTSGSNTTPVTVSGNTDYRHFLFATSTGVDQSAPIESLLSARVATANVSTTTLATVSGDMLVNCVAHFGKQKLTAGGGQTPLETSTNGSANIGGSYEATTTIGSTGRMPFSTSGTNHLGS